ncbi:MAG: PqqD family protein [Bradyrhizobium sp.]|nr:MAG: PqqD family protein [Bradyrhizobium sp.]
MEGAEARALDLDETFLAAEGLEITHAPDGCVVYDASREKVHYLNPTAGIVYELCDGANSLRAMSVFLAQAYGLDQDPVEATRDCLATLIAEGLVRPCTKSSAEA